MSESFEITAMECKCGYVGPLPVKGDGYVKLTAEMIKEMVCPECGGKDFEFLVTKGN
jgi:Zn finger protein HypA/HybF involved in hydrogenase expression